MGITIGTYMPPTKNMEEFCLPLPYFFLTLVFLWLSPDAMGSVENTPNLPRFESGIFEGLMLAVDKNLNLTGYYREVQGEGVTKRCSFYIAGKASSSEIGIVTWNQKVIPGTLTAEAAGLKIKIEKGREHSGCGLVLLPTISTGMSLDEIEKPNWLELQRITSDRAYFFADHMGIKKLKPYVINGDVVGVLSRRGDFLEVEFLAKKRKIRGWIKSSDAENLIPPEEPNRRSIP